MTMPADTRALLARLAAREAGALAPCLTPSARAEVRDAVIRAAVRRFYGDLPATPAARAMADDLQSAADPGTALGDALAAILALNDGRTLGYRQLINIME